MITKKCIILLDIDETLLENAQYPGCADLIKQNLGELQNDKGVSIGICTRRPWVDAEAIYNFYELSGPIICEDGGVLKQSVNSGSLLLVPSGVPVKEHLEILISSYNFDLLTDGIVYINQKRDISSTIYFTDEAVNHMEDVALLVENAGYISRIDKDNNKITVSQRGVTKFEAIRKLFDEEDVNIYFITDSEHLPKRPVPDNVSLYSVGNNTRFNEICDFVANDSFAKGTLLAIDDIKQKHFK